MQQLFNKFKQNIAWYTLEACLYQTILLGHHLLLYRTMSSSLYAQQSILFATIYLFANLANFGLDTSLMPFFTIWSRNKQACVYFFSYHMLPNYVILSCLLWYLYQTSIISLSPLLFGIISLLIIFESTKRTAKIVAQQLFKMYFVTTFEVAAIILYVVSIWGMYYLGYKLTLHTLFIPMLITSCITLSWYLTLLYQWYKTLSAGHENRPHQALERRIIKSRILTYLHTVSHLFFSTNFLIPLLALTMPILDLAYFAITAQIIQTIFLIMQKILTPSTSAVFAHIKNSPNSVKQDLFNRITGFVNNILYIFIIFFLVNYRLFICIQDHVPLSFILFLIWLNVIHLFMIAYEKWYILNEKMNILLTIILAIASVIGLFYFGVVLNPYQILALVAIGHLGMLWSTIFITRNIWNILPKFAINWYIFITGLSVTFAVYFLTSFYF